MLYPVMFGEMLAVHDRVTEWHPPPNAVLITTVRTASVHRPGPAILAVHGVAPNIMLVISCTSITLTDPSWFRSQLLAAQVTLANSASSPPCWALRRMKAANTMSCLTCERSERMM